MKVLISRSERNPVYGVDDAYEEGITREVKAKRSDVERWEAVQLEYEAMQQEMAEAYRKAGEPKKSGRIASVNLGRHPVWDGMVIE